MCCIAGGLPSLWCMIETAKGIQNVDFIANLKPVHTLVFGSNDLTKDLRARHTPNRFSLFKGFVVSLKMVFT